MSKVQTQPSLEIVELSRGFIQGLMDAGQDLCTVITTPTVDLFALIGAAGYLTVRLFDFASRDWLKICGHLPPDTYIDPAEWEYHSLGFESLYIPPKN